MTRASPFATALRSALDALSHAAHAAHAARPTSADPFAATEALIAKKLVRDLEQTLARLEQKGSPETDLISIACHDLKDPLASIVMGAGFLR